NGLYQRDELSASRVNPCSGTHRLQVPGQDVSELRLMGLGNGRYVVHAPPPEVIVRLWRATSPTTRGALRLGTGRAIRVFFGCPLCFEGEMGRLADVSSARASQGKHSQSVGTPTAGPSSSSKAMTALRWPGDERQVGRPKGCRRWRHVSEWIGERLGADREKELLA